MLDPKNKKIITILVPTVILVMEKFYVVDGVHCWHTKCSRGY